MIKRIIAVKNLTDNQQWVMGTNAFNQNTLIWNLKITT